ncbi:hypothetical protein BH11PSE8_BH11PSE8_08660 [soil metagenome]
MNSLHHPIALRSVRLALIAFICACAALLALLVPLQAVAQTASLPQALANDVPVSSLSGAVGTSTYYTLVVPAGATQAVFSIVGTSGDADLHVRYGSLPTQSAWDYRPYTATSNETVTVNAPTAGTWYVMVRAYSAYSGLTLRGRYTGGTPAATQLPVISPAPGSYSGLVAVSLSSATAGAVIRYTLDGSAPSASSEVYVAPIQLTATTQVRAMGFASGLANSAIASGTYTITNAIRALTPGLSITGLSGATGSVANFRLAVPSGMSSVTLTLSGGTGDADLYVKYGQLATTSVWDQRPYLSGNNETVTINTPQAGDYFVMVHGYAAYSGASITGSISGTATSGKPDLRINVATLNPRITTETFGSSACEIEEGTIVAGTRKLLRFNTQTENIGTADLVLGNPAANPKFEWAGCHGHYHFRSFAEYRLLDNTGSLVRTGRKVGFCLMDITRIEGSANPAARYNCSNQGIQAGWADIYSSNLSGQWIDITGLPAGAYTLEITIDPMNVIDELDETNNVTRVNVTVP